MAVNPDTPAVSAPGSRAGELSPEERSAAAAGTLAYHSDEEARPYAGRPVPRWHIHRRMYDWVLGFAHHKHSTAALAGLSFAESSFFPIPPDVLLMPLALGNRRKALWFALVCTVASVLGGILGWLIGYYAWEATAEFWYNVIPGFTPEKFATVTELYNAWGLWIIFAAAFTPIPYKVFTIASGVFAASAAMEGGTGAGFMMLPLFIVASFIGRGMRFFLVAGLMWAFGRQIVPFIDKYFNLLSVVFVVLLIGGFALIRFLH